MNLDALKHQLITHEGLRLKPYRCTAGKLSLGVGRNLDDVGITEGEAHILLEHDIVRCAGELDKALPWWKGMTEARRRVLLDMCFNLGITRLLGFKKTLTHMKGERYTDAADEMLNSTWADQVGQRAKTLALMMRTGK